jgi:hypothetical protein
VHSGYSDQARGGNGSSASETVHLSGTQYPGHRQASAGSVWVAVTRGSRRREFRRKVLIAPTDSNAACGSRPSAWLVLPTAPTEPLQLRQALGLAASWVRERVLAQTGGRCAWGGSSEGVEASHLGAPTPRAACLLAAPATRLRGEAAVARLVLVGKVSQHLQRLLRRHGLDTTLLEEVVHVPLKHQGDLPQVPRRRASCGRSCCAD